MEKTEEKTEQKEKKNIIKELIPYIVIILIVVLLRAFIITPVQVEGTSMYPTLKDTEILLLKKYDHSFERFDIVVFDYNGSRLIKRIVGFPGEYVEYKDNKLYINGNRVKEDFISTQKTGDFKLEEIGYDVIPDDYYFVMGDNRNNSTDSRIIGLVHKNDIAGSTNLSLFPFSEAGKINK